MGREIHYIYRICLLMTWKVLKSILKINYTAGQIKMAKSLEFETLDEKFENGRRLFTIGATVDGELVAEGKRI